MKDFLEKNKVWLRILLSVFLFFILFLPGYIFFTNRSGTSFIINTDFNTLAGLIFPLFGLYGFTLIWVQVMIGANMRYLTILWPKILKFHQYEGILAFLVVSTHVVLIIITYGFEKYIGARFLPENLRFFGILGSFAFYLLFLTTSVAFLRKTRFLRKHWRKVHYLNYAIFFLVLVHSLNLGSDTKATPLEYLWYFYLTTVVVTVVLNLHRRRV